MKTYIVQAVFNTAVYAVIMLNCAVETSENGPLK